MLNAIKQVRSALSILNPEEVRQRAERPPLIGLVSGSESGYRDMEDFLHTSPGPGTPAGRAGLVFRAGVPGAPDKVDLVLYDQGLATPEGAYTYFRQDPGRTIAGILEHNRDLAPALARHFPAFRAPVVDRIIRNISRENGVFALITALPDVIPSLAEIPWIFGEFASDTAFITGNQIRMAFLIAACCGKEVGYGKQKGEMLTLASAAFGWRALARELAGKIPLGGGLIAKAAIAYAGTFVVGKGLERLHYAGKPYAAEEREAIYREALEQGRSVAQAYTADKQIVPPGR